MVGDRPGDRLADPPGRVGRELEPAPILKPIDRLHEADVAFLDEVEQRQVAPEVPLRDRHDQTQVRLHQLALRLAHGAVAALDLLEERAQLPASEPDETLEGANLADGGRRPPAATLTVEFAEPLPAAPDLRHQLVDEGRLERHLSDYLLDGLAGRRDRRCRRLPAGTGPNASEERAFEPRDLALQAPDAREGQEYGANRLRLEFASFRQDDDLVGRDLAPTQPVTDLEKGRHRHRDPGERTPESDLADLDPAADLYFLSGSQQRYLADFLQVETNGILALRREPSVLPGGSLLRLVLGLSGKLSILSRIGRGHWGDLEGVRRRFSKCHRVTNLLVVSSCF